MIYANDISVMQYMGLFAQPESKQYNYKYIIFCWEFLMIEIF